MTNVVNGREKVNPFMPYYVTVNLEIFTRILFSRIALKTHIFDIRILEKGMIYLSSVNDRVVSPIHEGFIFGKIKPLRKFSNLQ